MRHRSGVVVAAATALLSAGEAPAREVYYPAAHPQVVMNVPDDWSVAETPLGLELQSPQKDALVLAAAVVAEKKSLDDWSKRALDRMRQAGVSFAKTGSPAGSATRDDAAATRFLGSTRGDHPYTFNALPTVDSLVNGLDKKATGHAGSQAGDLNLPTISTSTDPRAATTSALHATGHHAYLGGRLNSQPVDVELAVFPLDRQTRLLVEQESGPTDARGVTIVRSVKAVAPTGK